MTGFNHVLTGMTIAAVVRQPLLAPVLAFLSHFVLDSLPHFGNHQHIRPWKKPFLIYLGIDGLLCLAAIAYGIALFPQYAVLVFICGSLAFLPDWLWPIHLLMRKNHWFFDFHTRIQWGERPWGYLIEIPFTFAMAGLLYWLSFR